MSYFDQLPNELITEIIEHMDIVSRINFSKCSKRAYALVSNTPTFIDEIILRWNGIIIKQGKFEICFVKKETHSLLGIKTVNRATVREFPLCVWDSLVQKVLSRPRGPTKVGILTNIPNVVTTIIRVEEIYDQQTVLVHNPPSFLGELVVVQSTTTDLRQVTLDVTIFRIPEEIDAYFERASPEIFKSPTIIGGEQCCIESNQLMRFTKLREFFINSPRFQPTFGFICWFFNKWLTNENMQKFSFVFSMGGRIFDFSRILIRFDELVTKRMDFTVVFKKNSYEFGILRIDNAMRVYSFSTFIGGAPADSLTTRCLRRFRKLMCAIC